MKHGVTRKRIAPGLAAIAISLCTLSCGFFGNEIESEYVFIHRESLELRDSLGLVADPIAGSIWYNPGISSEGKRTVSTNLVLQLCFRNISRRPLQLPALGPCPWIDTSENLRDLVYLAGDTSGRLRLNMCVCVVSLHPDSTLFEVGAETTHCDPDLYDLDHYLYYVEAEGDSIWVQVGFMNRVWSDTVPSVWLGQIWSDTMWFPIEDPFPLEDPGTE